MTLLPKKAIEVGPELRPCWVRGQKALFHRWAVTDDIILSVSTFASPDQRERLQRELAEELTNPAPIIPNFAKATKVEKVTGLVEFEDGHMERVNPEQVCFIDTIDRLAEIAWPDSEEE